MRHKREKLQKYTTVAIHRRIAFAVFAVALAVLVVLTIGFKQTGAERSARLDPTLEPPSTVPPTATPVITNTPAPTPSPTPESTPANYVKTLVKIDGSNFAVLASRQAAQELMEAAAAHFRSMCIGEEMELSINNRITYSDAGDGAETISYDEALAQLTGEDTPLKVVCLCRDMQTVSIGHDVNTSFSDEYYEGTVFVSSYGRDGKNVQTLEYTYLNGELQKTVVLSEDNLYPAVLEVVVVGTKPLPDGDAHGPEFAKEDCPTIDRALRMPSTAKVVKYYGFYDGTIHNGIDFGAEQGARCNTVAAGTVRTVMERGAYGLTVDVDHGDGLITRYAGLADTNVSVGDVVSIGDEIGKIADDGLHFELIIDGRPRNPYVYLFGLL